MFIRINVGVYRKNKKHNLKIFWNHNEKQTALIFLDAEQAFDNLNLPFLFKVLEDRKFLATFIKWVRFTLHSKHRLKGILQNVIVTL